MNKVTLILPYFGSKFPNFFQILLDSMYRNNEIKFLIFTNIDTSNVDKRRKNVKFVSTTLESVRSRISKILGYSVELSSAYKLCDYKPFYGLIFEKYLNDSEWWGYFDSDIIFGDLNNFIKSPIFDKYDRIFTHGHLTFYRNVRKVNQLCIKEFKNSSFENYKKVTTSKLIYGFDEWGDTFHGKGLSAIIDETNYISQYDNISLFADIYVENFKFITTSHIHLNYLVYKNGEVTGVDKKQQSRKFLYVHLQKRKIINHVKDLNAPIYIFPNYLTNDFHEKIKGERKRWEKNDLKRRIKRFIKEINLENLKLKFRN